MEKLISFSSHLQEIPSCNSTKPHDVSTQVASFDIVGVESRWTLNKQPFHSLIQYKMSMYVRIHFIGPKTGKKNWPTGLKQQRIEKFDVLVAYLWIYFTLEWVPEWLAVPV